MNFCLHVSLFPEKKKKKWGKEKKKKNKEHLQTFGTLNIS